MKMLVPGPQFAMELLHLAGKNAFAAAEFAVAAAFAAAFAATAD